mmetsp:Transcript_76957/g.178504  ORF Transcript_76957/g.178504 Transcript_76957/m.178504 type:complete len:127 (+) Transcript_76957:2456-2836(+)
MDLSCRPWRGLATQQQRVSGSRKLLKWALTSARTALALLLVHSREPVTTRLQIGGMQRQPSAALVPAQLAAFRAPKILVELTYGANLHRAGTHEGGRALVRALESCRSVVRAEDGTRLGAASTNRA